MRVVHVFATGGAAYGTERTVLSVLRGLAKQGAEARAIVVVEPRAGGMAQPTRERLRECGAAADVIDAESRLPFAIGRQLRRLLDAQPPDVLHSHGYKCDMASLFSRLKTARVTTVHGWCGRTPRERLYEWLGVQCQKRMDAVVALCEDYRQRLIRRGVSTQRVHVVPVGIDPAAIPSGRRDFRQEWGVGGHETLVVQVGRLSPEKAPHLFVEVAARLSGRLPNTRFALAGDGPLMPRLQTAVVRLSGRVLLAGYVMEVGDVLRAADVVLNCSTTEGLPGALLEAGAMGVPAVATAVGGVPDIIQDGVTGILCPPGDVEAIKAAVARLIEDTELRENMGAAARERVERVFGVEACTERLIQVYEGLLS